MRFRRTLRLTEFKVETRSAVMDVLLVTLDPEVAAPEGL
jgi:hypothetical protein